MNSDVSKNRLSSWLERKDLENYHVNREFLKLKAFSFNELSGKSQHWVFNHIPKTGGTTFEKYASQLFLMQECLHINAPDLNKLPSILHLKKHFPRFIAGHHPLHGLLYQLLPEHQFVHITLLRKPISRVISYYNYLSTRPYHAMHESVKNLNFNAFLAQDNLVEISNGQAKRLAGLLHNKEIVSDDLLFKAAKDAIDNCFTLVGVIEKFDSFLEIIEKKCQVRFNPISIENTSEVLIHLKNLPQSQIDQINTMNTVDNKLYNYVVEKFNTY